MKHKTSYINNKPLTHMAHSDKAKMAKWFIRFWAYSMNGQRAEAHELVDYYRGYRRAAKQLDNIELPALNIVDFELALAELS